MDILDDMGLSKLSANVFLKLTTPLMVFYKYHASNDGGTLVKCNETVWRRLELALQTEHLQICVEMKIKSVSY